MGIRPKEVNATSSDDQLDEERTTFTRTGDKEPGFAGSIVPTLEEKTVGEQRPPESQTEGKAKGDKLQAVDEDSKGEESAQQPANSDEATAKTMQPSETNSSDGSKADQSPKSLQQISHPNGASEKPEQVQPTESNSSNGSHQARTADGDLYGAPADASKDAKTDDEPPHARASVSDADESEKAAPAARVILRKNLNASIGSKAWTLPTPTPKVDPQGFEDPISDEFWKNVWVACAVHNVRIFAFI